MSSNINPLHTYSLRARNSKTGIKITSAAASNSDQDISDQNGPSPAPCRLFSDVVTGNKSPKIWGGCNQSTISEEENDLQDLGMTKRSDDPEDLTPDQGLNHWTIDNPNLRRSRSLSSLADIVDTVKPTTMKPVIIVPEPDLVAAVEKSLTAAQKDKIK